jgi:hypothetical protein
MLRGVVLSAVIDEKFLFSSENIGRTTDIAPLSEPKRMKHPNAPQLGASEWTLMY